MKNLNALTKQELVDRFRWRCDHGHNGIAHWNCWDRLKGVVERVGYFDIEATNLAANFGYCLSYCILGDDNKMVARCIEQKDILAGGFDKRLMAQFVEDVWDYDRLIGYYSKRFDAPYLRTRCEFHGLVFPLYRQVLHTDAYDTVKHKFKFHSNRLAAACEFFGIPAKGHPLKPAVWQKAQAGDKKALAFILEHNKEDVTSLKALWEKIGKHHRTINTTI